MANGELIPVIDFAQKIKAKYPQYKDVDDTVLAQKMIEKYPQYKGQVDMGAPKKKENLPSVQFSSISGVPENAVQQVTTPKGIPIKIAPTVPLAPDYTKGLQDRIQKGTYNINDIGVVSKSMGVSPVAANAYMKGDNSGGVIAEFTDIRDKKKTRLASVVQNANADLGLQDIPERVLSSPEEASKYIDKIEGLYKGAYLDKKKRETIDKIKQSGRLERGDVDMNLLAGFVRPVIEETEKKAAQMRNMIGDRIIEQIAEQKIPYDQKVKIATALQNPRYAKLLKTAISDRVGEGNAARFENETGGQFEILNADKAVTESRLNKIAKDNIVFKSAMLEKLLEQQQDPALNPEQKRQLSNQINALKGDIATMSADYKSPEQLEQKYPTLFKRRLAGKLNEFFAIKSGNVKGYEGGAYEDIDVFEFLRNNGFDPKDQRVVDVLANQNKYLKDYSFFGSPLGSFTDVFSEAGKSIGDLVGMRDDLDRMEEKKQSEVFPATVGEKDEYQLTERAKIGQTMGRMTGQVLGQGVLQLGLMGAGRMAGLSSLAASNSALWSSGMLVSFDQALKSSYDLPIGTKTGRLAYAGIIATINAAAERIFPEMNLLRGTGINSIVQEFARRAGQGGMTREAASGYINKILGKIRDFGKSYAKATGREVTEETVTSIGDSLTGYLFGDPNMNMEEAVSRAKKTAIQTAIGIGPVAAMGALKKGRQLRTLSNMSDASVMYNSALYPDEARDAITEGFENKLYGQQERDEKLAVLNTAINSIKEMEVAEKVNNTTMARPQRELYVANLTSEKYLESQKKNTTDKVLIAQIEEKIANLQSQRLSLLANEFKIDDDGQVIEDAVEKVGEEGKPMEVEEQVTEVTVPSAEERAEPDTKLPKLSVPIEGVDEYGVPIGEDVPAETTASEKQRQVDLRALPDTGDASVAQTAYGQLDQIDFNDEKSVREGVSAILETVNNKFIPENKIEQVLSTKSKLIGSNDYLSKEYLERYIAASTKDFGETDAASALSIRPSGEKVTEEAGSRQQVGGPSKGKLEGREKVIEHISDLSNDNYLFTHVTTEDNAKSITDNGMSVSLGTGISSTLTASGKESATNQAERLMNGEVVHRDLNNNSVAIISVPKAELDKMSGEKLDEKFENWLVENNHINDKGQLAIPKEFNAGYLSGENFITNKKTGKPKPKAGTSTVSENPALKDVESTEKALDLIRDKDGFEVIRPVLALSATSVTRGELANEYHQSKKDGTNPKLVKAVEELLAPKQTENPAQQISSQSNTVSNETEKTNAQAERGQVLEGNTDTANAENADAVSDTQSNIPVSVTPTEKVNEGSGVEGGTEVKEGFTEGKDLNKIYAGLKAKHGDKKAAALYEAANRLVNPNKNTIVEIRGNGVVVKEGGKYILKPFGNTDANSKKWTLYKGLDVTYQFAPIQEAAPLPERAAMIEDAVALSDEIKVPIYRDAFAKDPETGLRELAQQLNATPEEAQTARELYGDNISAIAKELFPDEKAKIPEGGALDTQDKAAETERADGLDKSQVDKILTALDKLKINTDNTLGVNLFPAAWNGAVNVIKSAIRGGMAIASALNKGAMFLQRTLLRAMATENVKLFEEVYDSFKQWLEGKVNDFSNDIPKFAKILSVSVMLNIGGIKEAMAPVQQISEQQQEINGLREANIPKIEKIMRDYYAANDEEVDPKVMQRAISLWEAYGMPTMLEDTVRLGSDRPFAINGKGSGDAIFNIKNFDDFIAEMAHIVQYKSGAELDSRRYATDAQYDSIEYDRVGSEEYDAHKVLEGVLGSYIMTGPLSEDAAYTIFEGSNQEFIDHVRKSLKKYKADVFLRKDAIQFLDSLKIGQGKVLSLLPGINLLPAIWNGGIEVIKKAIQGGMAFSDAIKKGIAYMNEQKEGQPLSDEEQKEIFDYISGGISEKENTGQDLTGEPSIEDGAKILEATKDDGIGITHEQTSDIRSEYGLPEYEKEAQTVAQWDAEAKRRIEAGEMPALLNKMREGGIPSEVEQRMMGKYIAHLEANVAENPSNENIAKLLDAVQLSDRVGGSDWGRAGVARKGIQLDDKSLGGYFIQEMEALGVEELTEQQKADIKKEWEAINEARGQLEKEKEEFNAKVNAFRAEQELAAKKPKGKSKKTDADFKKDRQKIVEDIREKLRKARGEATAVPIPYLRELIAISPDVAKMVASYAEQGITKLAEMIDTIHSDLAPEIEGITKDDVRDLIAGAYNEKKPTKTDLSIAIRDMKDEAALLAKYQKLVNGEDPRTTKAAVERNQQIKELRDKIREKQKEIPIGQKDLDAAVKKVNSDIAKLEGRLKKKDYENKRKTPLIDDPDIKKKFPDEYRKLIKAKDKYIALENERKLGLLKLQYGKMGKFDKGMNFIGDFAAGFFRALQSTADFSAVFRQGLWGVTSRPGIAAKAFIEMFKQATSSKRFDRWLYDLKESDAWDTINRSGLFVADPNDFRLQFKEEAFMSNLAHRVPLIGEPLKINMGGQEKTVLPGLNVIRGSERAYAAFLNKLRVDMFAQFMETAADSGKTFQNSPELYKAMAKYINDATGRGKGAGVIEKAMPVLSQAFFSPRLMASRLSLMTNMFNPSFYAKVPYEVKKRYFADLIKFIGFGVAVLALAKYGFGADTEDEPTSPNFGKIKSGNTTWDIWGGFQQYVRLAAAMIQGKKTDITGREKKVGPDERTKRSDVLVSFLRGKSAPTVSLAADLFTGRTFMQEKVNYSLFGDTKKDEVNISNLIASRMYPLIIKDVGDAVKEQGWKAVATVGVPALFGIGVQTYGKK